MKNRLDFVEFLPEGSVGIELGVAEGVFSNYLLQVSQAARFYSVDRWSGERSHDDLQYMRACELLRKYGARSIVLRMDFENAVKVFENDVFDFIYIDGYAHQGQQEGIFSQWWPKLKDGGVMAGHDYSARWPLTIKAVDEFVKANKLSLNITSESEDAKRTIYPSWWVRKGKK